MNFLKQTTRNQIALTIRGTNCQDLKTFAWGHTCFFKDLKYFMKSDYAKYLEEEKEKKPSVHDRQENINHYWGKFQLNIRHLNL